MPEEAATLPSGGASLATDISGLTEGSGGRGRGRGGGYRGRQTGRGRGPGSSSSRGTPTAAVATFEGREEALKGHVYDIVNTSTSASVFITTTEEIAEFAGRTLKMGNYVKRSMEQMEEVTVDKPVKPTAPVLDDGTDGPIDDVDQAIYKEEVKSYVIEKKLLQSSMQKAYSIIYGQCSAGVRAKIEAMSNHVDLSNTGDPIGLLKNIKTVMTNFQTSKCMAHAILECKKTLFAYKQGREQTIPDYHKRFKGLVDVIEYNGGSVGAEQGLFEASLKAANATSGTISEDERKLAVAEARDIVVGCLFILGADRGRFGKLQEDLENDFMQGSDKYPKDLTEAYKLLTNWKQDPRNHGQPSRNRTIKEEVSFANLGTESDDDITEQMSFANLGGRDISRITCFNCQRMGHYASDCTNERVERPPRAPRNDGAGDEVQLLMDAIVEDDSGSDFSFHTNGHARGHLQIHSQKFLVRVASWLLPLMLRPLLL